MATLGDPTGGTGGTTDTSDTSDTDSSTSVPGQFQDGTATGGGTGTRDRSRPRTVGELTQSDDQPTPAPSPEPTGTPDSGGPARAPRNPVASTPNNTTPQPDSDPRPGQFQDGQATGGGTGRDARGDTRPGQFQDGQATGGGTGSSPQPADRGRDERASTQTPQSSPSPTIVDRITTPNTDITDRLTRRGGVLTEAQEARLAAWAADVREDYGEPAADRIIDRARTAVEPYDVDPYDPNTPDTRTRSSRYAEGVLKLPTSLVGGGVSIPNIAETSIETIENAPATIEQYGAVDTATTAGQTGALILEATYEDFKKHPWESLGTFSAELATGAAAFKAVEKAGDVASSARVARKSDVVVDEADISNPSRVGQTTGTEYPEFSDKAVKDTEKALQEFRDAASEMPEELKDATQADELLYHGTEVDFPSEGTVTAGERSEVSGQFFAGDLSTLRLRGGDSGGITLKPRLPRLRDKRNVVVTEPKSIDAVPDELGGSRVPGEDLDMPNPDAETGRDPGRVSEYMLEEGGEGEAFIQPKGTRTSEQEAIIPEGTPFEQSDLTIGVRLEGGDVIPANLYKYGNGDLDTGDLDTGDLDTGDLDVTMSDDLPGSSLDKPDGSPGTGGALTGATLSLGGGDTTPSDSTPPSTTTAPSGPPTVSSPDTAPSPGTGPPTDPGPSPGPSSPGGGSGPGIPPSTGGPSGGSPSGPSPPAYGPGPTSSPGGSPFDPTTQPPSDDIDFPSGDDEQRRRKQFTWLEADAITDTGIATVEELESGGLPEPDLGDPLDEPQGGR